MLRAKEILDASLELEPHEREQIANDLWGSLECDHDQASIDKAWDDELARRAKELDEGPRRARRVGRGEGHDRQTPR